MFKKLLFVLLALFLFLKTSVPARAQTAWSDPKKLSVSANTDVMPSITTDANGYLHAVWMQFYPDDGVEDENNGYEYEFFSRYENPGIYYSKWNGDSWSAPVEISQNDATGKWAGFPAIAADSNNKLHVVWYENVYNTNDNPQGEIVYASSVDGGVNWTRNYTISDATEGDDILNLNPRIAVDSSNTVHVIYSRTQDWVFYDLFYTQKNGVSWSVPEDISENYGFEHNSLAVGPGSTVNVAMWTGTGIWFKKYEGSWTSAVLVRDTISSGDSRRDPQYPKLLVDGNGRRHLVWGETSSGGVRKTQYAASADGVTWVGPTTLNTNNIEWTEWGVPLLGITKDSKNNIYAGWGERGADGISTDAVYRKCLAPATSCSWQNKVLLRNIADDLSFGMHSVDSPYLYQDIWDNQHFIWTEKKQGTSQWEIWYSIAPTAWATIGNGGGNLSVTANSTTYVTLTVPVGAVSSTNFSIAIGPLPESANPNFVTIPRSYYFGPSGANFTVKSLSAVFFYTDAEIIGADERSLGVYVWNGQTNSWNFQTGRVTTSQNKLTSDMTHFSLFGMRAPKVNLEFLSPTGTVTGTNIPVSFNLSYADGSSVPPVVSSLDDLLPGANVHLRLKNPNGEVIRNVYSDAPEGNQFNVNNANYQVNISTFGMPEGDYTLDVLLGGNLLDSINVKVISPPIVTNFLPPLSNEEIYTMSDGSTLPIKFNLNWGGNVLLEQEDVEIRVDSVSVTEGNLVSKSFNLGEGSDNIRFDSATGQYILNLHTKELGLTAGKYTISVLLDGQSLGTIQFELVEGGKSKGQNK